MDPRLVLVIGGGGREHAIQWALSKSPHVSTVICAPGNAGTPTRVALDISNHDAVVAFIKDNNIALTIIGPEAPLVAGLSDFLREKGHLVVGASQRAAELEGSKVFAKEFMRRSGIPTADFRIFTNATEAKKFAQSKEGQSFRVIKADGLAAGKGVVVAKTTAQVLNAIDQMLVQKKFGDAGAKIILEQTLSGPEVSVIALTDGKTLLPLPAAQDHKRVNDGDQGPNTGGMGAYAPTPFYDAHTRLTVNKTVIDNFLKGLHNENLDYRGIIYFGLMLTDKGPMVLEFNVRLGDPEAQVLLPMIDSDMFEVFTALAKGELSRVHLKIKNAACCTVVLASGGYPEAFQAGYPISGLDKAPKKDRVIVFHAGTKIGDNEPVTSGGRVLCVTGLGRTLDSAVVRAYQGVKKISFKDMHFRHDIAAKAFANKTIKKRIVRMKTKHAARAKRKK